MHELAICQALLDQVEDIARQRGARVTLVRVAIGPLSGVEPQLLQQAYTLARAGTAADSAALAIEETPVRVRCRRCDAETEAIPNRVLCGACGDWRTEIVSGDEMMLMQLELEVDAVAREAQHV